MTTKPSGDGSKPRTKAGRARSRSQLDRDRRVAAEMYLQGYTQAEIAERLGLGTATVSRDLQVLTKQWREAAFDSISELRSMELVRYAQLERELWTSWQLTRRGKAEDGSEEELPGDPAYVERLLRVWDRRAKLLGLDAPTRQEWSGPGGGPIGILGSSVALSDEERSRAIERLLNGNGVEVKEE